MLTARAKGLPQRRDRDLARAAERDAADRDARRAVARVHRRRRDPGRDRLLVARDRPGRVRGGDQARLPDAAGRVPRPHACRWCSSTSSPTSCTSRSIRGSRSEDRRSDDTPSERRPTTPARLARRQRNWSSRSSREQQPRRRSACSSLPFFVADRDLRAAALAPYEPRQQVGTACTRRRRRSTPRDRRQRRRRAERADLRRTDVADRRVRGRVGRDDRSAAASASSAATTAGGTDVGADAHHRLLPRDPGPGADDRRRHGVRAEPVARDLRDRPAVVDDDRADRPRAGEERPRAGVREARAIARGEPPPDRDAARPAADRRRC